ncbi:putative carboxypeptidase S1 [Aaosphaeria arxii CBS 175.79]|uniref:Carboxypeptidase n=1 Tax=Aaosphaeria arxii CBS 175.79 TaxID=1450172 RepID=A0A6A5XHS1_9PLEO|nr:putative carboxypeptidase S1 [Aaosphaeria arxii CBS 175.79]KAF2012406.1 putative carboxypeptidase S1 [Aaosphaeria arxii CBS 175.79]
MSLTWPVIALTAPTTQSNKRYSFKRNGISYHGFEHTATGSKLQFVSNSGICETTPGVNQHSGYISVGKDIKMWFWFFEARQNPSTAPLAAWFGGGPGTASALIHGPCKFEGNSSRTTPINNTFSLNNYANMLYIDQPIGAGFSYGNVSINSTVNAAPFVWKFIQAFYSSFPKYKSRDFGIFTESYGGHFGPQFAKHILDQNEANTGEPINLVALGINNGWFDAAVQIPSYVTFSYINTYRPLIQRKQYDALMGAAMTTCVPALEQCSISGTDADCVNANTTCYTLIEDPIYQSVYFNSYDVREGFDEAGPLNSQNDRYLKSPEVMAKLGAQIPFESFSVDVFYNFSATGDIQRSFLSTLSEVVSAGVTTLIWSGDADWKCNWFGNLDVADLIQYPGQYEFTNKALMPYTIKGKEAGTYKSQKNLSFLRVYDAGHAVHWYQPELALQVFMQTMKMEPVQST